MADNKCAKLVPLGEMLAAAEKGVYAVGAFSPRYTPAIRSVLRAGQKLGSPLLIQIAQVEFEWYKYGLSDFTSAFWQYMEEERITIPVGLHLDHSQDLPLIHSAAESGFTSVMIDASSRELDGNISITREVVEMAHSRGVAVEGELGRIGSGNSIEGTSDEELFTNPGEAKAFVDATSVDALAVSVGTAHGVYKVREPRIDLERLQAIRALTKVPLVLHGGSGTPAELVRKAIQLPGGGVSKINIATDLELALLATLGRDKPMTNKELLALPEADLEKGLAAVQQVVEDKMVNFLGSNGHA
jgi:fructose-bisphosphate aldolase class II